MITPRDVWASAFHPLDRRSIQDWAAENITLPPVLTRKEFRVEHSRHFIGPLNALRSDRVREVCVLKPVRGGGSLMADVAAPWAIVNDHASVLWVFQDDKMAESHAELRQMPILRSVPAIRSMLSDDRHKTRKADILFGNGLPFVMTGPAIGNLQSRGFKWFIGDECWLWKSGTLGQAKSRVGDFVKMGNSKIFLISQGGEEESDWDFECRAGRKFTWMPKCIRCGEHMPIEWTIRKADNTFAGAVFTTVKNADGSYDKDASAATVRFVCPICGHEHPMGATEYRRTQEAWNESGDYFDSDGNRFDASNPPSHVVFRWHALIDYPTPELVKEWLAAQEAKHVGNFAPLVNFLQKRCTEMRSERNVHDTELPFARVAIQLTDPKDKAWPDEQIRFLSADRQSEDLFWVMVRAWSKTGESRRLWYGSVYGFAAVEAKRAEFGIQPNAVVVDSGYLPKGDLGVYAACVRYGWIAVKGAEDAFFWHAVAQQPPKPPLRVMKPWAPLAYGDPGEGTSQQGRTRCRLYRFSSPVLKDRVHGLIGAGLWVEPDTQTEIDKECARQMAAEFKRPKVDKFTGKRVMTWVCPTGNNHALDCAAMQVLCAMHTKLIPAGVELQADEPGESQKGPNA